MAHANWPWLAAVRPECGAHPSRQGQMDKHRSPKLGRFDQRLGSFYDRKKGREFQPAFDQEGKQVNSPAGKGRVVASVPHTQSTKGMVWDAIKCEMVPGQTG